MAEEIKTPMSDFDKVEQVKDTAEFILLQDGVNARVEAPVFEQKIIDKTTDRYLGKAETAESAKGNGGVAEGNELAVSGKDVYDYFTNGGGLNLFPNRKVPDFLVTDGDEAVTKIVNEDGTVTYKNNTSESQGLRLAIYNVSNKTNYTFSVVVKNITGSYRIQIGSSGGTYLDVAQSQLYTDNGKKYISGSKDSEITYLLPNVLLNPYSEITIESAMFEKGGISHDWRYNAEGNTSIVQINKFNHGWISSSSGNYIPDYHSKSLKSIECLRTENIKKLKINFTNKTEYEINYYVVIYGKNFNFLNRVQDVKEITLTEDICYLKFLVSNDEPEWELSINDFTFEVEALDTYKYNSMRFTKEPFKEGFKELFFDYKKNQNLDVLSTNEPNPVKYKKERIVGNGYIILPPNYNHEGTKTRLIIFAHGSGNTKPDLGHYAPYVDFLVKSGYAVADCHAWGKLNGNYIGTQFFGSKTNYIAYQAFYSYLMETYNLYEDIFLFGKSQGGMQAYGLPYNTSIPIKASCSLAGESSCLGNIFGYDDKDKFAYFEDMDFSGLEKDEAGNYVGEAAVMKKKSLYDYEWTPERVAYARKNLDKFMYYNPLMSAVVDLPNVVDTMFPKITEEQTKTIKVPKIPFICFVARDDMYLSNQSIKTQIQNGGGTYVMRFMPSGSDNPHGMTDISGPKIDVLTDLGYNLNQIPVAFVEMLEFFRQYE